MAEPKLQIEQRVERLEEAVLTLAEKLGNYEKVEKILNGTPTTSADRPDEAA